jgi:hypothetical protein
MAAALWDAIAGKDDAALRRALPQHQAAKGKDLLGLAREHPARRVTEKLVGGRFELIAPPIQAAIAKTAADDNRRLFLFTRIDPNRSVPTRTGSTSRACRALNFAAPPPDPARVCDAEVKVMPLAALPSNLRSAR